MISQLNSSAIRSTYSNSSDQTKESAKNEKQANVVKQGDMSKIEKIKESIESGEYRMDLQALSEKIAEELLQG